MKELDIVEIFYSIQGEGLRTGQATLFVRLAHCNLDCPFCDTEFSEYESLKPTEILLRLRMACVEAKVEGWPEWICLTGGEPSLQDCYELLQCLNQEENSPGFQIQVETNGTSRPAWFRYINHLTVSPKRGAKLHPLNRAIANEFKFIVDENFSTADVLDRKIPNKKGTIIFLQPESNRPEMIEKAVRLVKANPNWRLSLQMQKFAGIR